MKQGMMLPGSIYFILMNKTRNDIT